MQCPICCSVATTWRTVDGYEIARCRTCGHGFVTNRPSPGELVALYEHSGHRSSQVPTLESVVADEVAFPNSTVDAARIVGRCRAIKPSGVFLDIGCGFGFFSAAATLAAYEIDPVEFAEDERCIATQMLGVPPEPSTFEELERRDGYAAVVLMSQVLEHVHDPEGWIRKAARLLQPGGVVAVAVPSFDSILRRVLQQRDPYITPPVHLNYFTRRSLSLLMERQGLAIARMETVSKVPPGVYKRLRVAAPLAKAIAPAATRVVDQLGAGMFLNAYGVA